MFLTVLFIITKTWKQSKCPSTGKWEKETVLYPYNGIPSSNRKEQTRITRKKAADRKCYICVILFIGHSGKLMGQ